MEGGESDRHLVGDAGCEMGAYGGGERALAAPWGLQTAERIYRVSRGSGGKDRHSKVYTAKGIRDRRVRLSVSTAIQFYDLQDRLGYDQPSKAIEWLIKAASVAIDKLPSLESCFPPLPPQAVVKHDVEMEMEMAGVAVAVAARSSRCSSDSDVSKSELSLSRPDQQQPRDQMNRGGRSNFTDLLKSVAPDGERVPAAVWQGQQHYMTADYLSGALAERKAYQFPATASAGAFSPQLHCGSAMPMVINSEFNFAGEHSGEMTPLQFDFLHENLLPSTTREYNLNFSTSRGTLQSNSPAILRQQQQIAGQYQHLQQHQQQTLLNAVSVAATQMDGFHVPFLFAANSTSTVNLSSAGRFTGGQLQLLDGNCQHADEREKKGKI